MANSINDPVWQSAVPADVRGRITGTPAVSDGGPGDVWVVFANVTGPGWMSIVYDPATNGVACTISTDRAVVEADLRRRNVHGRVGLGD